MDPSLVERRRDARFGREAMPGVRAVLRPGAHVSIVDVGAGGALIEATRPLRPGARVHVQVVHGTHAFGVAALVLRCAVWSVDPHHGVLYRGALRFDEACPLAGAPGTRTGSAVPEATRSARPGGGHRLPAAAAVVRPSHRWTQK